MKKKKKKKKKVKNCCDKYSKNTYDIRGYRNKYSYTTITGEAGLPGSIAQAANGVEGVKSPFSNTLPQEARYLKTRDYLRSKGRQEWALNKYR